MASIRKPALRRELLTELRGDELREVAGAGTDTCMCLTGEYPTLKDSCLCSGPCDWTDLC